MPRPRASLRQAPNLEERYPVSALLVRQRATPLQGVSRSLHSILLGCVSPYRPADERILMHTVRGRMKGFEGEIPLYFIEPGFLAHDPVRAVTTLASSLLAWHASAPGAREAARVLLAVGIALQGDEPVEDLRTAQAWARRFLQQREPSGWIETETGEKIPLRTDPMVERVELARALERFCKEREALDDARLADLAAYFLSVGSVDMGRVAPGAMFSGAGWGNPGAQPLTLERVQRIEREIAKVRMRKRFDAQLMAVGILVGWGVPRNKARDAFRKA